MTRFRCPTTSQTRSQFFTFLFLLLLLLPHPKDGGNKQTNEMKRRPRKSKQRNFYWRTEMFLRKKKATKRETAGVVIKKGKQKKKKKGRRLTRNRFSLWILRFTSILEGSSSCLRLCGPITKANDSTNLLPWCAQFPCTLHLTRARPQVSLDNLISTRTWTCCGALFRASPIWIAPANCARGKHHALRNAFVERSLYRWVCEHYWEIIQ